MAKENALQITDEEIKAAGRRGLQAEVGEVRATSVWYNESAQLLVLALRGGLTALVPVKLLQGVSGAAAEDIAEVELWNGKALHWEKLDADLLVQDVLAGSFGTRAWMQKLEDEGLLDEASIRRRRDVDELLGHSAAQLGRKGGAARTEAKVSAARANGAKGGRPRKREKVAA